MKAARVSRLRNGLLNGTRTDVDGGGGGTAGLSVEVKKTRTCITWQPLFCVFVFTPP